jgi:hypothetical protein
LLQNVWFAPNLSSSSKMFKFVGKKRSRFAPNWYCYASKVSKCWIPSLWTAGHRGNGRYRRQSLRHNIGGLTALLAAVLTWAMSSVRLTDVLDRRYDSPSPLSLRSRESQVGLVFAGCNFTRHSSSMGNSSFCVIG